MFIVLLAPDMLQYMPSDSIFFLGLRTQSARDMIRGDRFGLVLSLSSAGSHRHYTLITMHARIPNYTWH